MRLLGFSAELSLYASSKVARTCFSKVRGTSSVTKSRAPDP
jgi:hypothetical protein